QLLAGQRHQHQPELEFIHLRADQQHFGECATDSVRPAAELLKWSLRDRGLRGLRLAAPARPLLACPISGKLAAQLDPLQLGFGDAVAEKELRAECTGMVAAQDRCPEHDRARVTY